MKVSLNQIEHLARKATRGAGRAWGLAFDAGRAVRWLHAYGLNGAPALAAHLDSLDGGDCAARAPVKLSGVWRAADGALDPLATGASMSDCIDVMPDIETAAIAYPLLAAGFVGCAAESEDAAFEVTWRGCVLRCARGRVRVSGAVNVDTDAAECMRCRPCEDDFRGRAPRIGATVDAGAWAILERHARRTHVAATSASRLTGAGAGLSDND